MIIFQGWSLKFIWWLGKINVKKKCLMCQIPIKMLKQYATPNSRLHKLKIYSSKGCRKTSQRWIYVASQLPLLSSHSSSKYSNFQPKISLQTIGFCFDWWIAHLLLRVTSISQLRQFRRLAQGHHCWRELCQLTETANFKGTPMKKHV